MVELLGHPQLVVHGEREPLLLGPVPQRGVEHVDGVGERGQVEVVPGDPPVRLAPVGLLAVGMGLLPGGQGMGVADPVPMGVGVTGP